MNVDPELMFDCLIYLNLFYFPMFAICEPIMCIAKYQSIHVTTTYIQTDATVIALTILSELMKLIIYKKLREQRKVICNCICVLLTMFTVLGVFYCLKYQCQVIKLEYILAIMQLMLAFSEIIFGFLQIFPCCKTQQYY